MITEIKVKQHVLNFNKILLECTESERVLLAEKFNKLVNNAKINILFKRDNDHVYKTQLIESCKDLKNFLKPILLMIDKAV